MEKIGITVTIEVAVALTALLAVALPKPRDIAVELVKKLLSFLKLRLFGTKDKVIEETTTETTTTTKTQTKRKKVTGFAVGEIGALEITSVLPNAQSPAEQKDL